MEPKPIIFVEVAAGMGGVEFSTLYLAQQLDRACWQPIVVCPQEGTLPEACRQAGVAVQIVPRPALRSTSVQIGGNRRLPNPLAWGWDVGVVLAAARKLSDFLAAHRPALVVTKGLLAHFYGGLAARWQGIPCLWHLQDFISERFGGIYRRFFGQVAYWLPDYIIVDGQPIARQLPKALQHRIEVIYNGVDTSIFRPGLDGRSIRKMFNIPPDALVIGHVARITPWKGQHYLLEAFARLAMEYPSSYLLFVGSPLFDNDLYEQALRRRVQALGLSERVIFAGYRTDLAQVLAAMDIFAYTSVEKDTSPLSLLSAMAMGLPVVAFSIEGIREVIGDTAAGVLAPVGQVDTFAQALTHLLNNAGERQQLAQAARRRAEMEFSLGQYVSRMEAAFARLV
jgi:glycosyltransferase involved in cell wall biosynthesis